MPLLLSTSGMTLGDGPLWTMWVCEGSGEGRGTAGLGDLSYSARRDMHLSY